MLKELLLHKWLSRIALVCALAFCFAQGAYAWHLHDGEAEPLCLACSVSGDNTLGEAAIRAFLLVTSPASYASLQPAVPVVSRDRLPFQPRAPPLS